METPAGSGGSKRSTRMPTPRLSERKRQLFGSPVSRLRKINDDDEDEDVDSLGILPLKPHVAANMQRRSLFGEGAKAGSGSANSSPETNKENKKTRSGVVVAATADQLPQLFTSTMRLNSNSSSNSRNSSPRTPKLRAKRADSSMSSPTSSSAGSPSPGGRSRPMQEIKTSCRRSPRTASAQKNQEELSSPETFQKKLSKVADMLMKRQYTKADVVAPRGRHSLNLKTTAQVHTVKPKRVSLESSSKRRKSTDTESDSEDGNAPISKAPRRNEHSKSRPTKMESRERNTALKEAASEVPILKTKTESLERGSRNPKSPTEREVSETTTVKPRNSTRRTKSPVKMPNSNDKEMAIAKASTEILENSLKETKPPVELSSSEIVEPIGSPEHRSIPVEVSASDAEAPNRNAPKRGHLETLSNLAVSSTESDSGSPQTKMRKMSLKSSIPTMAFYSHSGASATKSKASSNTPKTFLRRPIKISPNSRPVLGINKGVRHKIRKRHGLTNRLPHSDLDNILSSLNNERLRNLITTKREERAKVEEVHQILRSARDPIKMAKPLSVIEADDANNNNNVPENLWQETSADFSDLSEDEQKVFIDDPVIELEPIIPIIRHEPVHSSPPADQADLSKRKFFKSGRRSSTCMEVRITDNIRASVSQGKIALVQTPRRKPRQVRVKSATIFSAEQATVDAILKNLDDTVIDEIVESKPLPDIKPMEAEDTPMETEPLPDIIEYAPEETIAEIDAFAEFRKRLPYQTNDPEIVEQQQILLEFLISNNICTEQNFEIFIANPDNYKEEANRIVDELYMVVNSEEATQLAQMETLQEPALDIPPPQDPPTTEEVHPKLFPIFTQRLQPVVQKSMRRRPDTSMRLLSAAGGSNQYQIDAGQKAFGARQCQQCGLVYTVHEPEEEQLHREYHNSIHVLRFKGWIDEDIVAVYPEWASDGRIIRINERAPAVRLERLRDLIGVVDKELGYSSYIVPKIFVAFLAVRKQQIVGFCLVQPLSKAHRFIQVDGTDYFSEESYPASCGVSRIWVSPLHRRCGIARKLLRVVQCHTVLGQEIAKECIAFSTPTDDGRCLARQFTGLDNFLTYDQ
ncbi:N-acetyltransferase eco [Drosophila biarmipes]|uniref:N-acetyltransferase eco n=1 Tax=Drosophila biarmipes TaxID=125945 RepID=UPI0007E884B7|nr:N-acetyltransferase eco [Drosophila biarmipes]